MPIVLHAEDDALVNQGLRRYGNKGAADYSKARSASAELVAVDRALTFVRETGARVHFFHLSTAGAVERIAEAKRQGLSVSASTCPHYLLFDDTDVARIGAALKCNPSIKSASDRAALLDAVRSGEIDIVSTDHAPHTVEEKKKSFEEAPSGVSSADLFMPLMLTLVARGELDLQTVIRRCSEIPDRGRLSPGRRADLVLVDLKKGFRVTEGHFASKAKQSPYVGMELFGLPVITMVRGRIVVDRRGK
jgi:dihydroorotase (multifunctional complex type)